MLITRRLALSVTGLDIDAGAVAYARDHYGRGPDAPVFDARDLATLADLPADSVDLIISFETVEHVADPERFLADCRRLLTPGGRIVCSVPNEWVDETGVDPGDEGSDVVPDDRLRLIFTCCHPALAREAQVALTLRLVCGVTTEDIARAFLVTESTMAARVTRAKKKISDSCRAARIAKERASQRFSSGRRRAHRYQAAAMAVEVMTHGTVEWS